MSFWSGITGFTRWLRRKAGAKPRAFLSHSWQDKPLARRIARRLSHRGVQVWVDEFEMEVGTDLPGQIAREVASSTHLLVLLTMAAGNSKWVTQEIKLAESHGGISIIPLIAEDGVPIDLLDKSLGIAISDPWKFEDQLDIVARAILGRPVLPDRDISLLKQDLVEIGRESPELRGLIAQLSDERGVTLSVAEAPVIDEHLRHPAETALIELHESLGAAARRSLTLVTAGYFVRLGVGYEVLRRQIAVSPKGAHDVFDMFSYLVTHPPARKDDLDGICHLFDLASPPIDLIFSLFVERNFAQFSPAQRNWAVRYMTVPYRPSAGFAADAAFDLFSRLPDSAALRELWLAWVRDYEFGGKPDETAANDTRKFYGLMNEAARKRLTQFDPVMDLFEVCFRNLARKPTLEAIAGATRLIKTASASETGYIRRRGLADELARAVGSSEWKESKYRNDFERAMLQLAFDVANDRDYDDDIFGEILERIEEREARQP
jgi:TIR domain